MNAYCIVGSKKKKKQIKSSFMGVLRLFWVGGFCFVFLVFFSLTRGDAKKTKTQA
jgi:hypothetical protein